MQRLHASVALLHTAGAQHCQFHDWANSVADAGLANARACRASEGIQRRTRHY